MEESTRDTYIRKYGYEAVQRANGEQCITFDPVGREVCVYFTGSSTIFWGVVLYMPQSASDCWIIETEESIQYIQTFEKMEFTKEKTNE